MKLDRSQRTVTSAEAMASRGPRPRDGGGQDRRVSDVRGLRAVASASAAGPDRRGLGPRVRRYSRFVRVMKLLLPSVAVLVLGLILAWPQVASQVDRLNARLTALDLGAANPRTLVNPRYHGVDEEDQPYTLVAASAVEQGDNPDLVDLERPQGDILLNEGRWLALRAQAGLYSKTEETLNLNGDVMLYRDDGVEVYTPSALVDLRANTAHGTDPVRGQGPGAFIDSTGFRLLDGGQVIVFTGRAHLVLTEGGGIAP